MRFIYRGGKYPDTMILRTVVHHPIHTIMAFFGHGASHA